MGAIIGGVIGGVIGGAVALLLIIWLVVTRNRFVGVRIKIQEAESGIDIALTKRFDTLTKEIEAVKGAAKHEREVNVDLTQMRAGMAQGASMKDRAEASSAMDVAQRQINVFAENYPALRAQENFQRLQQTIKDVELQLQAARRAYNANVTVNNRLRNNFPSNLVGAMFGYNEFEFFTAEETRRQDVNINF